MDQYEDEVRERWGDSQAYAQSQSRTSKYTHEDFAHTPPALGIAAKTGLLVKTDIRVIKRIKFRVRFIQP